MDKVYVAVRTLAPEGAASVVGVYHYQEDAVRALFKRYQIDYENAVADYGTEQYLGSYKDCYGSIRDYTDFAEEVISHGETNLDGLDPEREPEHDRHYRINYMVAHTEMCHYE